MSKEKSLSNDYKRELAEKAVSAFISHELLSVVIDQQSNRASWDGEIILYSESSRTKKNISELKIQIKGTSARIDDSYLIAKKDLENYQDEGIIYFVGFVDVNEEKCNQLYYAILNPLQVKTMLATKKYSVSLAHCDDISVFYKDVRYFINDKRTLIGNSLLTIGEERRIAKINGTYVANNQKDFEKEFLRRSHMLIATLDNGQKRIIEKAHGIIGQDLNVPIYINDVKHFDQFSMITDKDNCFIQIGDCFRIIIPRGKDTHESTITWKIQGDLEKSMKLCNFVIDFLKGKEIRFGEKTINYSALLSEQRCNEELKNLQRFRDLLFMYSGVLNKLGCAEIFDAALITKEESINIIKLNQLDKRVFTNTGKYKTTLFGKQILYVIYGTDDFRWIANLFDDNVVIIKHHQDDDEQDYPIIFELPSDDLVECYNAKLHYFQRDFKNFNINAKTAFVINNFGLTLLNAFDKSKRQEFLDFAIEVFKKLIAFEDIFIYRFNYYQSKYRKHKTLTIEQLTEISIESENSKENKIKFMCEILLENKFNATKYYKTLTNEEQKEVKKLPIYNLF